MTNNPNITDPTLFKPFVRTKKVMFTNNKGGVGKTTLCFEVGVQLAKMGYKVALVDLDPQSNLTRLALGDELPDGTKTVYDMLLGVIKGGQGIDKSVRPVALPSYPTLPLTILPGHLKLSLYESSLGIALFQAMAGQSTGYVTSSALQRYLSNLCLENSYDLLLIDTGPSLGVLNQTIFLMTDYFVVPMMPDSFSLQGIENLGDVFSDWKSVWEMTGKALAKRSSIPIDEVLENKNVFVGYMINSYNIRNQEPLAAQKKWMKEIPPKVKAFLSERLSVNGLVAKSYEARLGIYKDAGTLAPLAQKESKSIVDVEAKRKGTTESQAMIADDLKALAQELINRLHQW